MTSKKNNEASVPATAKKHEQSGTKLLNAEAYLFFRPQVRTCSEIIDADTIQAEANEIRPKAQPEVIVA